MLQFLQSGKMLYVLAAICVLGMISKLVTSSLYKRLIKETGNMALTDNKDLRGLKQRTENMFLLNQGIRNVTAYIEKQIYGFRFMNLSLDSWDNLSIQAMILCFLAGGAAAFGAYWYRCDSYYIVLYGSMGVLAGLFLVFVDNGANIAVKRQQLADSLVDYVENSPHFYKNVDKTAETADTDKKNKAAALSAKPPLREIGRRNLRIGSETAAAEETCLAKEEVEERTSRFQIDTPAAEADREKTENARRERPGSKIAVLKKKENRQEPRAETAERDERNTEPLSQRAPVPMVRQPSEPPGNGDGDELAKSIEQLRLSLEQIAASGERRRREYQETKPAARSGTEQARRELKPDDIRLLGELLQQYLT